VALLQLAGIKVGLMTGESLQLLIRRAKKIQTDFLFYGVRDKLACLNNYLEKNNIKNEQVAFVGDEINDYCLLHHVGLFITVPDASRLIRQKADLILDTAGGKGALREVAELILCSKGSYEQIFQKYQQMYKIETDKDFSGNFVSLKEMSPAESS
jgi:3-deoxy-D-manno-octulosonate 8-phosphate phosphatase (KDO 8-P phosphatase)